MTEGFGDPLQDPRAPVPHAATSGYQEAPANCDCPVCGAACDCNTCACENCSCDRCSHPDQTVPA